MTEVVPPRERDEVYAYRAELFQQPELYGVWADAVAGLLPPHAHQSSWGDRVYRWTNQQGLWELMVSNREDGRGGRGMVTIRAGWNSDSLQCWTLDDPGVPHVRSVLTVLGAIEGEP